jgi:DNA-binding NarL/FixJ family response regulator
LDNEAASAAVTVQDGATETASSSGAVLLVEDHPLTAAGASRALQDAGFDVDHAPTAARAVVLAASGRHVVALVDLELPDHPGRWVVSQLTKTRPELPVVVVSSHYDESRIVDALEAGAVGFLSKLVSLEVLVAKVRLAINGEEVFDDESARRLIGALRGPARRGVKLAPREQQILKLLAGGRSTKQIATELHISSNTVKDAIKSVFRKLGVSTRAAAVHEASRRGLLS